MIATNQHISSGNNPKFSVLMSIYHKEIPSNFERAMQSIWNEQSVKPSEIVLVEDGPLTVELDNIIDQWKLRLNSIFHVVSLEKNLGTGEAKNFGLEKCSFEIVAIMDTDDISLFNRFEKQLNAFERYNIDVCGAWVNEFEVDETKINTIKRTPEYHQDIVKFSKYRSPTNHVTTMFKKTVVMNSGGYQKMMWLEDYYLFVRLIQSGARFYNIQESLVNVRAGAAQLERRRGLKYAFSELTLQRKMLELGFLNLFEFSINVILRFAFRMVPNQAFTFIYSIIRKF